MGYKDYLTHSYKRYLKSPQWQAKRQQWFATYGKWCRGCLRKDGPIQLDHMSYENLGNEPLSSLMAFCPKCHREKEKFHYQLGRRTDGRVAAMKFIAFKRSQRY